MKRTFLLHSKSMWATQIRISSRTLRAAKVLLYKSESHFNVRCFPGELQPSRKSFKIPSRPSRLFGTSAVIRTVSTDRETKMLVSDITLVSHIGNSPKSVQTADQYGTSSAILSILGKVHFVLVLLFHVYVNGCQLWWNHLQNKAKHLRAKLVI